MENSVIEYGNIDFRLNILYNYVYNTDNTECYIFKPILKKSIDLIKLKEPEDYDFTHVLHNVNFKYLYKQNNLWHFTRLSTTSFNSTITLGKYTYKNTQDMSRGPLINTAMLYILSELVIIDKIKHVILPIMFFDVKFSDVKKYSSEIYSNIKNDKTANLSEDDKLYVSVTERYFKLYTLEDYLTQHMSTFTIDHWKTLFFQVFVTLHKISEKLHNFRHNKLDLQALKLYKQEVSGYNTYNVNNTLYKVPNLGFEIKFSNFENSFVSDYIANSDTELTNPNPYYDVHYFLNSLYLFLKGNVPKDIKDIMMELLPEKYRTEPTDEFTGLNELKHSNINSEIFYPLSILKKNSFFKDYIVNTTKLNRQYNKKISRQILSDKKQNQKIKLSKLGRHKNTETETSSMTDVNDSARLLARKNNNENKFMSSKYKKIKMGRNTGNELNKIFKKTPDDKSKKASKPAAGSKGGSKPKPEKTISSSSLGLSDFLKKKPMSKYSSDEQTGSGIETSSSSESHKKHRKHRKQKRHVRSSSRSRSSSSSRSRSSSSRSISISSSDGMSSASGGGFSRSRKSRNYKRGSKGDFDIRVAPEIQAQINKLPKGYYEVPQGLMNQLPPLTSSQMMQPQNNVPMMPQMMAPPMMQPQMMAPMMPPPMMQQPMQQPMYGNGYGFGSGAPDQTFMQYGGGKKKPSYKLVNDSKNKDFFF
jgi:hypothetical protein